jgi:hypothetical protein
MEKEVVKKMLHEVPERRESVAISMETLLDLNSLSLEEATEHLRAIERRKKKVSGGKDSTGRLLLTEEEWTARMKKRDGSSSGTGSGGRESRNSGKPLRGRGQDGGKASASKVGPTMSATTSERRAIGPLNAARRSVIRPRSLWPKKKRRTRLC